MKTYSNYPALCFPPGPLRSGDDDCSPVSCNYFALAIIHELKSAMDGVIYLHGLRHSLSNITTPPSAFIHLLLDLMIVDKSFVTLSVVPPRSLGTLIHLSIVCTVRHVRLSTFSMRNGSHSGCHLLCANGSG